MLEYLLYAIIIAPAALTGYRRSVREGHDSTAKRQRTGRYKQAQKKALITKRYLDINALNRVGVTGLEPATSRPPDAYSKPTELHPDSLEGLGSGGFLVVCECKGSTNL